MPAFETIVSSVNGNVLIVGHAGGEPDYSEYDLRHAPFTYLRVKVDYGSLRHYRGQAG